MDNIYLIFVIILFVLAISDLIVGVSNDAVNFLNSAVGAKAAPFRIIMIVAAFGILSGAMFSNGMMEVARKGIFHPEHFYFSEIMIIFMAVMLTDILLLDLFNTFGLPTSTTVSIVFELLGAAVAISIIKIYNNPNALGIEEYINTGKALAIIVGILLSIVVAFSSGALVQFLTRLLFTFNYEKKLKYFGAIWGGIAITAITYFMLIKGAKGASFMDDDSKKWITDNALEIIGISLIGWTILLQLLMWIFRINILKTIVLVGTFALAMAFAGNDLVNFIGVPLAGFESFKTFMADPGASADTFSMASLTGKVKTDTFLLIIAGLIMVTALWLSRKARTVMKTEIDLSRQDKGDERFGSSYFARSIVRVFKNLGQGIDVIVPKSIKTGINKRFDQSLYKDKVLKQGDKPAFDMLRASVNLVLAGILISFATSMKLPLSTTYVTFMVAMGTSLADRSWGRESAVYRITGVISVIGGWFFTAIFAFSMAFVVANIINWGGIIGVVILLIIAILIVLKTRKIHKRKETEKAKIQEMDIDDTIHPENITERCNLNVSIILQSVSEVYSKTIDGLIKEDRKTLKNQVKHVADINKETKKLKDNVHKTISKFHEDSIETGPYYVQVLDYLRETTHCLTYISKPAFEHVDNNHKALLPSQIEDLTDVKQNVINLIDEILRLLETQKYAYVDEIIAQQQNILEKIDEYRKKQIKRIKAEEIGTKNSMLYLGIYHETKNMLLFGINLLKAHRDFVKFNK